MKYPIPLVSAHFGSIILHSVKFFKCYACSYIAVMTNDISSYVQDQIESISYNYENHES